MRAQPIPSSTSASSRGKNRPQLPVRGIGEGFRIGGRLLVTLASNRMGPRYQNRGSKYCRSGLRIHIFILKKIRAMKYVGAPCEILVLPCGSTNSVRFPQQNLTRHGDCDGSHKFQEWKIKFPWKKDLLANSFFHY